MSTRVNHHKATPALTNALSALSMEVAKTSIDPALKHLIDIRVSQLNGCTFCLDMHSKEAKNCRRARAAPVPSGGLARVPAVQRP
ncbi:4-carboxymuconolactone decarboxylase domain/alkylhydroperoxidase AhpD family core domain protein [Enterobacter hormaechei]|nr:4-carboxymuconolactone decarboxylase domain/alkylhydroperoxidase AhpD family core domain protein [Enterobacter hormaechei]